MKASQSHSKWRKMMYPVFALGCLLTVGVLFWKEEVRYTLPTPVPENHRVISVGDYLPEEMLPSGKAQLLHFFNPDCPCSRFNVTEFRELVRDFGDEVDFKVVIESDEWNADRFARKYKLDVQVVQDPEGKLADACGVIATPQAVIADANGCIFYKGNYNKARFCTQPDTRFAHQAITHLLAAEALPAFSEMATTAYGCNLPSDKPFLAGASQ